MISQLMKSSFQRTELIKLWHKKWSVVNHPSENSESKSQEDVLECHNSGAQRSNENQ